MDADLELTRSIVSRHLSREDARVFLFGSRARGDARPWSDIDLAVQPLRPLPADLLPALREALVESNVLLDVDVVDLSDASEEMRQRVAAEGVAWIG